MTDGVTVTSLYAGLQHGKCLQGSSLPNDIEPKIPALALRSSGVISPTLKTSVITQNNLKEP
jgi:hypothetical protein